LISIICCIKNFQYTYYIFFVRFLEWRADIVEKTLKELNIPRCDEYLKFLIIEFFHYYGYDFDFKKYTISPYLGTVIEKTKFKFQNLKSLEMPR